MVVDGHREPTADAGAFQELARSRDVVTVRGACHLRYRCATAAKAALGSHSMSG
ncbi:hypothetical protein SPURM210S_05371 [Streptomyces purpurascens]